MPNYKVIIKTRNGKMEEEVIDAKDIKYAKSLARRKGQVISIKQANKFSFEIRLLAEERQILLHRLSSMLASRLGASESLEIIRTSFGGTIKKVATKMLKLMENGNDIVQAIEKIGEPHFPSTIVALIKSGSKGGETHQALKDAAEFEVEMERIKRGSGKGLWGGIAGFVIAAIVTLVAKFYVAPKVLESQFFKMTQGKVDLTFINLLTDIVGYSMAFFFTIFFVLFLLGSVFRFIAPTWADNIIIKIPFYKDLVLSKNNYIILYGLAAMIKSGVSMEESLRLSSQGTKKGALKDDLERACDAIMKGRPWAQAMRTFHPTDRAALSVSQDKEQIANSLDALSYQYREDYKRVISSFGPSMQLVASLYLVLSSVILFGYTMLPMLQVAAKGV